MGEAHGLNIAVDPTMVISEFTPQYNPSYTPQSTAT